MLLLLAVAGCQKSKPDAPSASLAPSTSPPDTVLRAHWQGHKALGTDAGAYYLLRLWQQPESRRLETQLLVDFSTAPWRLKFGETARANVPGSFFGPLVQDAIEEESYGEIRQTTNQSAELVFAIRLDETHAGLWRTNLVAVIASLAGIQTMDILDGGRGWLLKQPNPPAQFELARVGDWTVLGMAPDKNALLRQVVGRIRRLQTPSADSFTNWLDADFDLRRLQQMFAPESGAPENLPQVTLAVTGDGGNVLTRAHLSFPKPLQLALESWAIPTNLLHEPLDSFTAVRGLKPWLTSLKAGSSLPISSRPDQLCFWASPGAPAQTYFAAPLPDAANQVSNLTAHVLAKGNPWLAARGYVSFEPAPDGNGLTWGRLPSILPFIKSVDAGNDAFVFGGLLPESVSQTNPPTAVYYRPTLAQLLGEVAAQTNLVYYDWELTGPRIQAGLYLGQFIRAISQHPQLSLQSASAAWLGALAHRAGSGTTAIILAGSNEISFTRKSTVGLTGAELQLLADWLESPQFPRGLYSLLTPPAAPQTPTPATGN